MPKTLKFRRIKSLKQYAAMQDLQGLELTNSREVQLTPQELLHAVNGLLKRDLPEDIKVRLIRIQLTCKDTQELNTYQKKFISQTFQSIHRLIENFHLVTGDDYAAFTRQHFKPEEDKKTKGKIQIKEALESLVAAANEFHDQAHDQIKESDFKIEVLLYRMAVEKITYLVADYSDNKKLNTALMNIQSALAQIEVSGFKFENLNDTLAELYKKFNEAVDNENLRLELPSRTPVSPTETITGEEAGHKPPEPTPDNTAKLTALANRLNALILEREELKSAKEDLIPKKDDEENELQEISSGDNEEYKKRIIDLLEEYFHTTDWRPDEKQKESAKEKAETAAAESSDKRIEDLGKIIELGMLNETRLVKRKDDLEKQIKKSNQPQLLQQIYGKEIALIENALHCSRINIGCAVELGMQIQDPSQKKDRMSKEINCHAAQKQYEIALRMSANAYNSLESKRLAIYGKYDKYFERGEGFINKHFREIDPFESLRKKTANYLDRAEQASKMADKKEGEARLNQIKNDCLKLQAELEIYRLYQLQKHEDKKAAELASIINNLQEIHGRNMLEEEVGTFLKFEDDKYGITNWDKSIGKDYDDFVRQAVRDAAKSISSNTKNASTAATDIGFVTLSLEPLPPSDKIEQTPKMKDEESQKSVKTGYFYYKHNGEDKKAAVVESFHQGQTVMRGIVDPKTLRGNNSFNFAALMIDEYVTRQQNSGNMIYIGANNVPRELLDNLTLVCKAKNIPCTLVGHREKIFTDIEINDAREQLAKDKNAKAIYGKAFHLGATAKLEENEELKLLKSFNINDQDIAKPHKHEPKKVKTEKTTGESVRNPKPPISTADSLADIHKPSTSTPSLNQTMSLIETERRINATKTHNDDKGKEKEKVTTTHPTHVEEPPSPPSSPRGNR